MTNAKYLTYFKRKKNSMKMLITYITRDPLTMMVEHTSNKLSIDTYLVFNLIVLV